MEKTILIFLFTIVLLASLGDLLVPVFIGTKYPNYNHFIDTISTLGTKDSPVQKYQRINLMIVGVLFLIFCIGEYLLFKQKTWAHNWYTVGIFMFGLGCILAGIFPEDIQGTSETNSGKIHGISSGIGFLFLILVPLWAIWIKEFNTLKIMNIILFILGLITFIIFLLSERQTNGVFKFTGFFQRLNLTVLYGALVANFIHLRNVL